MENKLIKSIFRVEDEINASPKTLLPYISTSNGLGKWFADKVTEDVNGDFIFVWDNEKFLAKKHIIKESNSIKFIFSDNPADPSFVEFHTESNQMTGTTFLTIQDYSVIDDIDDYKELYQYCLKSLKEKVGGKISSQ